MTESKLREALQKYGQHIGDCSVRAWSTPCFCGLDKTLSPQPPTSDEGTPTEKERELADAIHDIERLVATNSELATELATLQSVSAAPQEGKADYVDIVFDGPPSHESGRFVEVEDSTGKGIRFGEWVNRPDGYWALRINDVPHLEKRNAELHAQVCLLEANRRIIEERLAAATPRGDGSEE